MIGFDTSGVRLSLDSSKNWVFDAFALREGRPPRKNVAARVEIHGLPPDYAATLFPMRPRLVFPDGTVAQGVKAIQVPVPGQVDRKESAFIEPLRSALGVERLFYGDPDRYRSWPVLITVDDELYARYRDHPGDYAAEIVVRLQQYRRKMELPLETGAGQTSGSHRVTVLEVIRQSEGRTVLLRESNVRLLFDPRPTLTSYSQVYYAFVNRRRGEAFLAESFGLSSSRAVALGGFVVGSESERLVIEHVTLRPASHPSQPDAPRLDEAWLADATLVRVDVCYAGRLKQQLQVRGFRMDPR